MYNFTIPMALMVVGLGGLCAALSIVAARMKKLRW